MGNCGCRNTCLNVVVMRGYVNSTIRKRKRVEKEEKKRRIREGGGVGGGEWGGERGIIKLLKIKSEMYRNPNPDNSLSVNSPASIRKTKAPYNILDVKKAYDQIKLLYTRLLYIFFKSVSQKMYTNISNQFYWGKNSH